MYHYVEIDNISFFSVVFDNYADKLKQIMFVWSSLFDLLTTVTNPPVVSNIPVRANQENRKFYTVL